MRSPRSWSTGSALSMNLHYNESQTINMDIMNPDDPSKAWVGMFVRNEFPDRDLGVNYTTLANRTNGVLPWDYTEYRVDWSEEKIDYYIGGNLFRSVVKDHKMNYPQTPAPLRLKHWSVGNWFTMQGPPTNRSEANVGWVRLFFNSSLTTDQDREEFMVRCSLEQACSTDNMALRGSSPFSPPASAEWMQAELPKPNRMVPKVILIVCGSVSGFLVVNALLRRLPRPQRHSKLIKEINQLKQRKFHPSAYEPSVRLTSSHATALPSPPLSRPISYFGDTASPTPVGSNDFSLGDYLYSQQSIEKSTKAFDTSPAQKRPRLSWRQYSDNLLGLQQNLGTALPRTGVRNDRRAAESRSKDVRFTSIFDDLDEEGTNPRIKCPPTSSSQRAEKVASTEVGRCVHRSLPATELGNSPTMPNPSHQTMRTSDNPIVKETFCLCDDSGTDRHHMRATSTQLRQRPRIDHLAGLLTFSCLLVTAIQFSLTFSPASIDPGADAHYKLETWARKTIASYLLNLVWVGTYFEISSQRPLILSVTRSVLVNVNPLPSLGIP